MIARCELSTTRKYRARVGPMLEIQTRLKSIAGSLLARRGLYRSYYHSSRPELGILKRCTVRGAYRLLGYSRCAWRMIFVSNLHSLEESEKLTELQAYGLVAWA